MFCCVGDVLARSREFFSTVYRCFSLQGTSQSWLDCDVTWSWIRKFRHGLRGWKEFSSHLLQCPNHYQTPLRKTDYRRERIRQRTDAARRVCSGWGALIRARSRCSHERKTSQRKIRKHVDYICVWQAHMPLHASTTIRPTYILEINCNCSIIM